MIPYRSVILLPIALGVIASGEEPEERVTHVVPGWGGAIDPDGDCKIQFDTARGRLTIAVPAKPHLLSAEIRGMRLNAPRVLRDAPGDFTARVRVMGFLRPGADRTTARLVPYHGAGLLLWQDAANYVRLERGAQFQDGANVPYVCFEYRKNRHLDSSKWVQVPEGWTHLRLERLGHEVHGSYSSNGLQWTELPPIDTELGDALKIGVEAVNSAGKPLNAELLEFKISDPE